MQPDFSRTAADYSRHRQGFPDELFAILNNLGVNFEGARAVDLGTGTGTLARGMARQGATVTGIDPSSNLTAEAQRLDLEWGVSTQYINSTAEKTNLESDGFDIVASGQSWWWFEQPVATLEAKRILKPGGKLVICSYDWVPAPGNVVELTEKLIEKHNPHWDMGGGNGLHPEFITDLQQGGFEQVCSDHAQVDAIYTKDAWRGRVRASAGIGASLTIDAVERFDQELADALDKYAKDDTIPFPHIVFAAVGSNPTR